MQLSFFLFVINYRNGTLIQRTDFSHLLKHTRNFVSLRKFFVKHSSQSIAQFLVFNGFYPGFRSSFGAKLTAVALDV